MSKELIERLLDNRVTGFNLTVAAVEAAECIEGLEQQLATAQAALQAVSDDWDGEHFHDGGSSFMPKVNAALGRGEL